MPGEDSFAPEKAAQDLAALDRALALWPGDPCDEGLQFSLKVANGMRENDSFVLRDLVNREESLATYRFKLEALKAVETCEQRSPEWYEMRNGLITASDFAQAVGRGKFGTKTDFLRKKVRPPPPQEPGQPMLPPLKWGVMFESVVADIYQHKFGCNLLEFGLVKHPELEFLGASPDAITTDGIMLEIKAPFKRKITGEVPMQYFYQIQGQLEVCDLEECDYMECRFEMVSREVWEVNVCHGRYAGIIVETADGKFLYSDHAGKGVESQLQWLDSEVVADRVQKVSYWSLSEMFVCRIKRDRVFWDKLLKELRVVWDQVLAYRADPLRFDREVGDAEATKPRSRTSVTKMRLESMVESLSTSFAFTQC